MRSGGECNVARSPVWTCSRCQRGHGVEASAKLGITGYCHCKVGKDDIVCGIGKEPEHILDVTPGLVDHSRVAGSCRDPVAPYLIGARQPVEKFPRIAGLGSNRICEFLNVLG